MSNMNIPKQKSKLTPFVVAIVEDAYKHACVKDPTLLEGDFIAGFLYGITTGTSGNLEAIYRDRTDG